MIQNDRELAVTRERTAYFLDLLARLRISSRPEELPLVTSGYRAEVDAWPRGGWSMRRTDLAAFVLDVAERRTYARAIVGLAS